MENPRAEKVAVVEEVRERLNSASGVLLTEYRGLKVSELAELRRSLRGAGGDYKIYKNTLVRLAVADLNLSELDEMLTGPTAIAFVDGDAAAVAKALRDYSRTNPNLVVKGGLLGRSILSSAGAAALADLPSREVLLARLAGGLAAPLQQFAGLLQALPRNLAYGLKALIDQGGASGAVPLAADANPTPADANPTPADADPTPAAPGPDETAIEEAEAAAPRADAVSDAGTASDEPTSTTETIPPAPEDATEASADATANPQAPGETAAETEQ
jgi:large subunit ribosomal protein L10